MALGMNGEESPRDHTTSSLGSNKYEAAGVGIGITKVLFLAGFRRANKLDVKPLAEGNVPKSTNATNRIEQPVMVKRQKRLRSNGRFASVSNILEIR